MIVAGVLPAAGMGSIDAWRAGASQADCSRKRLRFCARQSLEFQSKLASFFLNSSQGKALFTLASGAAHSFRQVLPAGLRMIFVDGQSIAAYRRGKADVRLKMRTRFASRIEVFGSRTRSAERGDDTLCLRDTGQERVVALRVPANAFEIQARRHGRCIGPSFTLTKKKIAVRGYAHHEPHIDCS